MANKKTAKKLNRKPQVGDIIAVGLSGERTYLVLDNPLLECGESQYLLLNLMTGEKSLSDYVLWMRRWRKVA